MSSILYLEGKCISGNLYVTTPSVIALFTMACYENLQLKVIIVDFGSKEENQVLHEIKYTFGFNVKSKFVEDCPHMIQCCKLPATQISGELWCTGGLSSAIRYILLQKVSLDSDPLSKRLLGFRSGCLQACAEVSVWTKFCEVEITKMVDKWVSTGGTDSNIILPEELARFENHLNCPPITHNVLKKKQEEFGKKLEKAQLAEMKRKKLQELPTLEHKYAEGIDLTLADLFIFSAFSFIFMSCNFIENLNIKFPLTYKWYHMIKAEQCIKFGLPLLNFCKGKLDDSIASKTLIIPKVAKESLYKGDPSRYKPRWRAFTNQKDIDVCTEKLQSLIFKEASVDISDCNGENTNLTGQIDSHIRKDKSENKQIIQVAKLIFNNKIEWRELPAFAKLNNQLPAKRLERKQQQLENMALSVIAIAKPGDVIVDFCSGSGHLGILLAHCLPECKILLVENKEESLKRAVKRVASFDLRNIEFYHCNLDCFIGSFNIGVCLHACGVATDLVIKKCIDAKASFLCCPCCYGSIQSNHILKYPRSQLYHRNFNVTSENYYILSHAADQTHDEGNSKTIQGRQCMKLVDNDRLSYAKEIGYKTTLAIMNPPSCTPKNHILFGIFENA